MGTLIGNLSREALRRVIRDIVVDELQTIRGPQFDPAELDAGCEPDLDSLERFSVASRLNDFFALYESGLEDNLLRVRTLDGVLQVIDTGLREFSQYVNVRSGGTAGAPKTVRQDTVLLEQEVRVLTELFADRKRVVLMVPAHHIYGFIFGVLLPESLKVPVLDARRSLLGGALRPRPGDLVVAVPFLWERLLPGACVWDHGIRGVSSTAPLDHGCARRLAETPLERLIEVYGSSETGGIGWRDHWNRGDLKNTGQLEAGPPPFRLFPFWRRPGDGEQSWVLERVPPDDGSGSCGKDGGVKNDGAKYKEGSDNVESVGWRDGSSSGRSGALVELPDLVEWVDHRHLILRGRRDRAVQIGGHNVDLDELSRRIVDLLPQVDDCALRIDKRTERLRAFLDVPKIPSDIQEREYRRTLRKNLRDHEIPVQITWGPELPRTEMGKSADW